jgi:hypothetical protein
MSSADFDKWRRRWEQEQAWKAAWEKKHAAVNELMAREAAATTPVVILDE